MEEEQIKKSKSLASRFLSFLAWSLVSIVIFIFVLQLFLRSPWGQNIVIHQALKYVSSKTHTKASIDKLYFTINGNIYLQGLYLEDQKADTLVYSDALELNIPILPILRKNQVQIKRVDWRGLRANIIQKDTLEGYNFQFLLDAFSSDTPQGAEQETKSDKTQSNALSFSIGSIYFKNFDIQYEDVATGIESRFKVGELITSFDKLDIEKMDFGVNNTYLSDVFVYLRQSGIIEEVKETPEEAVMPLLALKKLKLHNIVVDFEDMESGLKADVNLGAFTLKLPKADLQNNQVFIDLLELKNTTTSIKNYSNVEATPSPIVTEEATTVSNSLWPDFIFHLKEIDMAHNDFSYVVNDTQVQSNIFNADAIAVSDFTLKAKEVFLKDQEAGLKLKLLSFKEASGLDLNELGFDLAVNNQELLIDKLKLSLNNNRINAKAKLNYTSLERFVDKPETASLDLNLSRLQLDFKDVFKFQPALRKNASIVALSKNYLKGSVIASGSMRHLNLPNTDLSWGDTKLQAKAWLKNLNNLEQLTFEVSKFDLRSKKEDIVAFLDEEALGLDLPKELQLIGDAKGDLKEMHSQLEFHSSQGIALLKAYWKDKEEINFAAALEINEYKLNELFKDDALGSLSFKLDTEGEGKDINHLNMQMQANLSDFSFKGYQIKDLLLEADLKDGEGRLKSTYKDSYLDYNLDSYVVLDSLAPEFNLHFDLKGANLQKLGLVDRDIRTTFKLDADFVGRAKAYDLIATVGDGLFIHDNKSYLLGDILATAHVESDTTSIWINNKIARLQLESNAKPGEVIASIKEYVNTYLYKQLVDSTKFEKPVSMYVRGEINEDPLLNEVLLMQVKKLDTVKINVDYDVVDKRLIADVSAPLINYAGNELKGLSFQMNAIQEEFDFTLGFQNIQAGPLDIPETKIQGEQRGEELYLNFNARDNEEVFVRIPWVLSGSSEILNLHVLGEELVLNKEKWNIPKDNQISFSKEGGLVFHNFEFSKGDAAVRYSNDLMKFKQEQVGVSFENFNLEEILNYLNPKEKLAYGNLNGKLVLLNPFEKSALLADLAIVDLSLLDIDLGKLSLKARALELNKYDFYLALKEGMVDLDLKGGYTTLGETPEMDLKLNINDFQVAALDGFSMGALREGHGAFTGDFKISGPLKDLAYDGKLHFKDAGFVLSQFNAPFSLLNTSLAIDNKGLYFDNFKVYDEFKNKLEITGSINTEEITNPSFDLKVTSDNFHVMNATAKDNDFLYGKAAFSLNMDLKGDMMLPKVTMQATISEDTDITYVLSTANASLESRDGIIEFVNRQDPDAVLTLREEQLAFRTFGGIDFKGKLKLGDKAKATIIIDKQTGDNFQIFGNGEFDVSIVPNGSMSLSGVYNVGGGHYQMNLYNLVNRKFDLVKGGKVTWNGDMLDAVIDVQARYNVEASASALMAAVNSGVDQATQNKFRQVLPFLVYLNIGGEIMSPEISFSLDMPEQEKAAIGGQVYGRVQQLNQQEDELNRQVFSLLVMNRFFPDSGSDGSQGGFAHIMRNNINDAISDQLNTFSDKLLGKSGIELDFGLESFTDYQGESPEERTQLGIAAQKKLFNNRLVMRVGSEIDIVGSANANEESNPIIGNVSIEYLLTPSGRYSLRGFRKNTYDNVIDGQLVVNGLALVYNQEYNNFQELWQGLLRGETKEEKEIRKKQEALEKEKEKQKKELEAQTKKEVGTRFEIQE